ncbi:LOW QUALITY PROTEIN: hypothetical protein Cgig2_033649 [Carnegiea gigantea]|uniref:Uncharacterized protein n=1 Tax=Carnegiea gigantea TaxID=171969 RepID=A0A9Q1GTQ6_9CARY|nr:LOW QUALITY PROTEIN: hypothetical protein Cgig2_033649 [Carnegiea gigantea]
MVQKESRFEGGLSTSPTPLSSQLHIRGRRTPNENKRKEKLNRNDKDQDYMPTEDCEDDERRCKHQLLVQHAMVVQLDNQIATEQPNSSISLLEKGNVKVIKKHRGPTMLFDVHARKWKYRVAILFNEKNQPIGPTDDDSEYIVPPSAEKWVMQSIRDSWRVFKCRIKQEHYYKYDNDADRWKHHPSRVPKPPFNVLLEYWNDPTVKEINAKSFEDREQQENMHTTGNTIKDNQPPSKRKMFEETRARKDGWTYKQSNGDTLNKIKRMKELESLQESGLDSDHDIPLTRGASSKDLNRNDKGSSPFVAPQLVDAIKASLNADMQNDLTAHKEKLKNEYNAR